MEPIVEGLEEEYIKKIEIRRIVSRGSAGLEAFRELTEEEILPINRGIEVKRVVVDVSYQTLSCYEGSEEVYFTSISTGIKFDILENAVDKWATPLGSHPV